MKKIILIITVLAITHSANAQGIKKDNTKKNQMYYSFAWGLFKSKDYPKNKLSDFESSKIIPKIIVKNGLDSTLYDQKSILWGAIQWSEKKSKYCIKIRT